MSETIWRTLAGVVAVIWAIDFIGLFFGQPANVISIYLAYFIAAVHFADYALGTKLAEYKRGKRDGKLELMSEIIQAMPKEEDE